MKRNFHYRCYTDSFHTIPEVMHHMLEIQKELKGTYLENLTSFNFTYYIITKSVYKKTGMHFFQDDVLMKKLDICFARYYFDALKGYTNNKPITPAWQITFDTCKNNTVTPIIYLALGVNAHVNNDLGMALYDVVKKANFYKDFMIVNPVIAGSLDEVIASLHIKPLYKPFMKFLIRRWRNNAWNNFINLQKQTVTHNDIEKAASAIGVDLSGVTSVRKKARLYKYFI